MGLIKAGLGALGGTLADQWKEFFYCESIPKEVLVTKGQKRVSGRSSNTRGSDNIITNGSGIAVADGQCMIIVEQGKVVDLCAEPGEYTYDTSSEPSIFSGSLGESIKETFKTIGKRFTYGGDTGKDQRVYYFNTKEILENRFGTANPIPFRVVDSKIGLDIDVSIRCSGVYSYKIADPMLFYTNVCGNVESQYERSELDTTLKSEFISALQPAFGKLSDLELRPNQIVTHNTDLENAMNESLSDLSVLGNLTTNEDYMPFMHSLTENTIKGNLYVPVIGSGTSNTEFEFITGHSTAFLPSGSNAYMLYIKNPIASIVSTLEAQGYSSFALHPYYAEGWNRTNVYNYLGFNNFMSLEDIIDVSFMREYQSNGSNPDFLQSLIEQYYPGSNMLIRQYVSDSYDYRLLIEDYENRDTSVPYFAFNVTMQNHGGYTTSCVNFDECIYATSVSKNYNKANKYLSLVKASDDAFRELIEYFSNVDEPTVICMFGDHQPSIETDFIAEVMGVDSLSNLTPEQEQLRHVTPFFIWANYDIEEKQIDKLSANYLSSLVLETAGVKLTEYNKYLLKLSETLPVIDTVGYIDNENNYYKWSDVSPYSHLLEEYENIQYNSIFDQKNIKSDVFYLDGYVPQATESDENSSSGED